VEFWWLFTKALVNLGVLGVVKFLKASPPRHQEHKADWLRLTEPQKRNRSRNCQIL
jgi:hypothetical protein